jgi:integrase
MDFVRWHGARLGRPVSIHGQHIVNLACTIANVLKHEAAPALADLRNTLKPPPPLHIKREHWVSLRELEAVAESCLAEGRSPYLPFRLAKHPGSRWATQFQRGVILKLLVRVPLRQRNVREIELERNLWKDQATGHWHLHFSGSDLKVGERQGRINEYTIDLSGDTTGLVPALEEWLQVYRPRLPGAATSPLCFLTQRGTPHTVQTLRQELAYIVARHTGQRFYPHLIRTIWATEYIDKTRDFTGAAYMLGDNVQTVLRAYQHILGKDQHAKAKAFLDEALQG